MAMSSDPGCMGMDSDPDSSQAAEMADKMSVVSLRSDPSSSVVKNGTGVKKAPPMRPYLSGRKMSLQERGTYVSSGSGADRYSRIARQPTIESKRVSISDSQVRIITISPGVAHLLGHTFIFITLMTDYYWAMVILVAWFQLKLFLY